MVYTPYGNNFISFLHYDLTQNPASLVDPLFASLHPLGFEASPLDLLPMDQAFSAYLWALGGFLLVLTLLAIRDGYVAHKRAAEERTPSAGTS